MDQLTLVNFENNRVRVFVCQNTLVCLLLSKVGLLWGEGLIMGKEGVFESLINFSCNISLYVSTSVFDLEIGN
jgi:alanine-alpha-ketoisovalerate/valine-pyruvate aminotransferase